MVVPSRDPHTMQRAGVGPAVDEVHARLGAAGRAFLPNGRTRLLGILGDPLDHSLSPGLHSAVLRRLDRNLLYVPVPVSANRLRSFLQLAAELGFVGCNVTTPFKERVVRTAEARDAETRRTKMANTLSFRPGAPPLAEGTDGRGISAWLEAQGLIDEPFGVLGFGATARSLVHASWRCGRPPAWVVTRRPGPVRRQLLSWGAERGPERLVHPAPPVLELDSQVSLDRSEFGTCRIWIGTWPPGVVPPPGFWAALPRRAVLLDLNYGAGRTTLADAARREGRRAADGLGPLLAQAALSLSIWLGTPVSAEFFRETADIPAAALRPRR